MKEKTKITRKLILFFIVISIAIFMQNKSLAVVIKDENNIITNISIPNRLKSVLNGTTVDLTGIVTGEDAEHKHIYENKYDNEFHWQGCIICGDVQNKQRHTIQTIGNAATCNTYVTLGQEVCTNNCGYSKQIERLPHIAPDVFNWQDYVGDTHLAFQCKRCGGGGSNNFGGPHYFEINGEWLTISQIRARNINVHSLGTKVCRDCKLSIDLSVHKCATSACRLCNAISGPTINYSISQIGRASCRERV